MNTSHPPHIVFVTGEYPPAIGGVGDYTAQLKSALEVQGVGVTVVTSGTATAPDVIGNAAWDALHVRKLLRTIDHASPTIVHLQYQAGAFDMRPVVNALPALVRRALHVPVVTTFHDLLPPYVFPKAGRLRPRVIVAMARASNACIATNPADLRDLLGHRANAIQIPIGMNLPPAPTATQPDRSVAFFGLPTQSKGILELIAALGHICADRRPPLLLVGAESRPSRSNDHVPWEVIERMCRLRGVQVTTTGFLHPTDAADTLARAGVIALPFTSGATLRSGSLLAALGSGRPVVATSPDRSEDLGALVAMRQFRRVPPRNTAALAQALHVALEHETAVDPLPVEFTWPSIAGEHLRLYAALTAERASGN